MMYAIKIPQEGSQSFFKIVIFCNTQRQGEIKKKATIYVYRKKDILPAKIVKTRYLQYRTFTITITITI